MIQATAQDFTADLSLNQDIAVTIDGGYDCNYTGNTGTTTLSGMVTVSAGILTVNNLGIH